MHDNKLFTGLIRISRMPEGWSELDNIRWWYPKTNRRGKIIRPARMSVQEKLRFLDYEHPNEITTLGLAAALSYLGSSSGSSNQWSQYFAVGTGAISSVSPSDTSLANEVFRKTVSTFSVAGTEVDISISFGTTDAEFTYTNAGLWGNGASGTLGSGDLHTHALFSYTKGAYAINIDYIINLL